jgi:hypothetical protein
MLKLYGTRMSRAARSLWALEELGLARKIAKTDAFSAWSLREGEQ